MAKSDREPELNPSATLLLLQGPGARPNHHKARREPVLPLGSWVPGSTLSHCLFDVYACNVLDTGNIGVCGYCLLGFEVGGEF